jgi:hypothetical protein
MFDIGTGLVWIIFGKVTQGASPGMAEVAAHSSPGYLPGDFSAKHLEFP